MEIPFFSIIIPVYNREDLIQLTIKSIQDQSFIDWECIVVDDGSKDETKNIVSEISAVDTRIKYFHQDNAERSAARNNGISKSSGKYICFLDSDDLILENHLEVFHDFIKKNNIIDALLFTSYDILKNNEIVSSVTVPLLGNPADYFLRNPVNPSRVCISSKIANEFHFRLDAIIVEDMIYWLEVSHKYPVHQIDIKTVYYRLHDNNSVNILNDSYSKMFRGLNIFIKDKPEIFNSITTAVRKDVFSEIYFGISKYFIFCNNRKKAIYNMLLSVTTSPIHKHTKHRIYIMFLLLFFDLKDIKLKLYNAS